MRRPRLTVLTQRPIRTFPDTSRAENDGTRILDEFIADLVRSENAKREDERVKLYQYRGVLLRALLRISPCR